MHEITLLKENLLNELWSGENLSSSLLLLVRRWAEFLQRYRKNINIEGFKVKNLTDIKRIFRRVCRFVYYKEHVRHKDYKQCC